MNKNDKNIIIEMKEHLEHILSDINKVLEDNTNKYIVDNIITIKSIIVDLRDSIETRDDLFKLNLKKIKELSNMVYELNVSNNFSFLTDHISNELFAFEFLLQEELKG